ncbi:hypothetical protein BYT27DRAFT_7234403 [Phlegmacium glaucopus]|nr:hypothetical protein BYT27DRAFT_7234403 [Phlegmacium glaucopus]
MTSSHSSPDSLRPFSPISPAVDLRHMTSNVVLGSPIKDHKSGNRVSQHLRTTDIRLGSRSPNSIPSSPTSVRSSSSAIFERDIEPIVPPSPPVAHHPPNPHRIPRSKGTEQLENSVPSVLDSAAAILAGLEDIDVGDQVAVVSPASPIFDKGRSSGFASPIGSFRSRSPSPLGVRMGVPGHSRAEMLLSLPTQPHSAPIASPTSVLGLHNMTSPTLSPSSISAPRPAIVTLPTSNTVTQVSHSTSTSSADTTTPSVVTPTSAYFSTVSDLSDDSSHITTTAEHPPNLPSPALSPSHPVASQSIISSPISSPSAPTPLSLPPSPIQVAKKRLSFMSYSDLLSSTPASTQPLSSFTTCASSTEPPPHIPSVSGLNIANAMQYSSHHLGSGSIHGSPFVASGHGGLAHAGNRDNIAMLDNVGGEWEREGLGRGLEERLEALVIPEAMIASPVVYPVV